MGVEAGVVRRQLGALAAERVMALPMGGRGSEPGAARVGQCLQDAVTAAVAELAAGERVVLMGLGGSLSPDYGVGDVLIYHTCVRLGTGDELKCDRPLSLLLQSHLQNRLPRRRVEQGRGLTSDRVIWSAAEKRHLGQSHQASVVDMEGWTVLAALEKRGIPGAVVRVISDDCGGDIPDVGAAIGADGRLRPWPLARSLGRDPLAALRLIRGSLVGLRVLGQVAQAVGDL
ncbi:MAG: hypothetical protein VKK04_16220 [Synechococcales bacterium]|nr:hypothetical protein [Synechococcales bacterium]